MYNIERKLLEFDLNASGMIFTLVLHYMYDNHPVQGFLPFFETTYPKDWMRDLHSKNKWDVSWQLYYAKHGKLP